MQKKEIKIINNVELQFIKMRIKMQTEFLIICYLLKFQLEKYEINLQRIIWSPLRQQPQN